MTIIIQKFAAHTVYKTIRLSSPLPVYDIRGYLASQTCVTWELFQCPLDPFVLDFMDTDQNTPTALASTATEAPEVRGAGGKLRKPPPRKPPATPYARPPETARRPWLSKLVDPAFRLIAGGATRILPSFFSSSSSSVTPAEDQGNKWQAAEKGYDDDSQGQPDGHESDLNLCESKSTEMTDIGDTSGELKRSSDVVLNKPHESGEQAEENRLCDIERLVKVNKLSRDEFNRLVELLNSRAVDLPKGELGKGNTNLTSRKDDEGLPIAHGLPKFSIDRRREESKGAIWGSSTPLRLSNVQDQIDASPIEIARAYMDSRATEASPSCKSMMKDVEGRVLHGVEAAVQPYDPSPYVKTSTCWPGVVVQDAYITPQSQRSRHRLHNFPRTPYSRTLLSKSKSRLTHIEGDYSNISSTPLSQSQKVYLQDKSKVDASETGYGSFGPIHRISRKVGSQSSSRRPAFSSLNGPSKGESSVINEGFTPTVKKSLDPDGTSTHKHVGFEAGVPAVHMHTSLMAKKILEHIDRNVPTPKEKSAELNLASKWKNPESSVNLSTSLSNENDGLQKLKGVSHYKYDGLEVKKSTPSNEGQGKCHVDILPRDGTDKSIGIRKEGTLGSDVNVCSSIPALGNEARSMQSYGRSQTSLVKSTREDALKPLPGGSEVNREKKLLTNSSASKPVLARISIIKKPDSRWTSASDNGSGFTFPVSTSSSSVFSEPPTPSIMPLFSSGVQNQSKERPTELSYSFGLKRSNPPLVFSFPSTSNSSVHSDAGVIKFNFGSNDKARLSFSFGENAVCC